MWEERPVLAHTVAEVNNLSTVCLIGYRTVNTGIYFDTDASEIIFDSSSNLCVFTNSEKLVQLMPSFAFSSVSYCSLILKRDKLHVCRMEKCTNQSLLSAMIRDVRKRYCTGSTI